LKIIKLHLNLVHMMTRKHKTTPQLFYALALSGILVTSFIAVISQLEQKAIAQNASSNPLGKVPVIGKYLGGGGGGGNATNTTSAKSGANATSGNQSSNPLANVPIIGKILGGK
jgi:hypothetical protein